MSDLASADDMQEQNLVVAPESTADTAVAVEKLAVEETAKTSTEKVRCLLMQYNQQRRLKSLVIRLSRRRFEMTKRSFYLLPSL
jgi:hypothetical protein